MPEFRQSPTNGEWVVIAGERGNRPHDYKNPKGNPRKDTPAYDETCPFCPGGKAEGDEILYQVKDGDKWLLKALDNKFAALKDTLEPKREKIGFFNKANGYGKAEVIIESPVHNKTIATMSLEEVEAIIKAYKIRCNDIKKDQNINFINVFKNHGPKAGASLKHPHSQIIGSLVTPPNVSIQMYYARRQYDNDGECIYCAMLNEELNQEVRILEESDSFVSFCPYASKSPYEIRLLPKRHSSVFGNISDIEIKDLAYMLRGTLRKLYDLLDDPDYNFIIRSVTTNDSEVQFYHWYLVIIPKVSKRAGFEIGTGIYINSIPPELCAEQLRSV